MRWCQTCCQLCCCCRVDVKRTAVDLGSGVKSPDARPSSPWGHLPQGPVLSLPCFSTQTAQTRKIKPETTPRTLSIVKRTVATANTKLRTKYFWGRHGNCWLFAAGRRQRSSYDITLVVSFQGLVFSDGGTQIFFFFVFFLGCFIFPSNLFWSVTASFRKLLRQSVCCLFLSKVWNLCMP